VLFPTMSRVRSDPARLRRMFLRGLTIIALLALPSSVVVIVLAPELIQVLLGPAWTGVIAPFQILAMGFFFRTSYRISDSLAYATGAVYRRAWRQGVYASCVAIGAGIGTRYGLAGVATGVLAALAVNYALMAQLSLSVLGLGWMRVARAQSAGLVMGVAVGVIALAAALILRAVEAPMAIIILLVATLSASTALFLVWRLPHFFLGDDAGWLWGLVTDQVSVIRQRHRPHRAKLPAPPDSEGSDADSLDPAETSWPYDHAPGARVYMTREGITEGLVSLTVELPDALIPLDRPTEKLVRRYLRYKNSHGLDHRCGMARAPASIAWEHPQLSGENVSLGEFAAAYAAASASSGRSIEQTDDRLADVREYVQAVERGEQFPPILLYYDGRVLVQLDGARRILAHLVCGRRQIDAILVVRLPAMVADPAGRR
jgi:hypothetical protein